jgi:hypothetical protein
VDASQAYYIPGTPEPQGGSKLLTWVTHFFRRRRASYLVACLITAALSYWAENWFAPAFFVIVFATVLHIMHLFRNRESVFVIECRIEGELITHCAYYQRPVLVPNSWIRIHLVPRSRLKDAYEFGDSTPPVKTHNIVIVDFFEKRDNGDLILVYPVQGTFNNFALYSRMNSDLVASLASIHKERLNNQQFKAAVTQLAREGRLGSTKRENDERLALFFQDANAFEGKMASSAAAQRDLFKFYKDTIPQLHRELLMLYQELPRKAMAEAAKFAHVLFQHPMSRGIHDRIQSILDKKDSVDYEAEVRRRYEEGLAKEETSDLDEVRHNPTEGQAVHVEES